MDPFRYSEDDPNPVFNDERSKGRFARKMSEAEEAHPNTARFILWSLLGGICLFLTLRIALGPALEEGFESQGTDFGIGFGMGLFSFGAWWSLRTARYLTTVAWLRRTLGVISVLALLYGCLMVFAVTRMF
jgi:hypothetical protein